MLTPNPCLEMVDQIIVRSVWGNKPRNKKRRNWVPTSSFILHPLRDTLPTGRVSAWVVDGRVKFKSDEPPLLTCGLLQWDSEFRNQHYEIRVPHLRCASIARLSTTPTAEAAATPPNQGGEFFGDDSAFIIHHSSFQVTPSLPVGFLPGWLTDG